MVLDNWKENRDLKAVLPNIKANYDLIEKLGGGGTSNVYLIKHKFFHTDNERALKIIDTDYILKDKDGISSEYDQIKKRFIREAQLYKRISHPNIVKIENVGVVFDEERKIEIPYLIMHYIKGETLKEKLIEKKPLDMKAVFSISKDILSALIEIHKQNIVHRDIKSGNIMIREGTDEAILIDFGLAKDLLSQSVLTKTGTSLGTTPYMSPEQFDKVSNLDKKSDIYSFGVVVYEMSTGGVPFKGTPFEVMYDHYNKKVPNIREKNPNAHPELQKIIKKAMAKTPNDRYRGSEVFLRNIEKLKDGKPKKSFVKYLIVGMIAAVFLAVLIVFNPLGIGMQKVDRLYLKYITSINKFIDAKNYDKAEEFVNKAKEIAATDEIRNLSGKIADGRQKAVMNEDFENIKDFLNGKASKEDKQKQCHWFLSKYKNTSIDDETKTMISQTNEFITRLQKEIADAKVEQEYKKQKGEYDRIKGNIDLKNYLAFIGSYPRSEFKEDLKKKLKTADKNLPLEKHWLSISKNNKGYYERAFANNHLMTYIPKKNFWIDKYEVSIKQFKKIYKNAIGGDDLPVTVSYDKAERYCNRYGFRLPTKDEWVHAAGKAKKVNGIDRIYPWGNESPDEGRIYRANFFTMVGTEEQDKYEETAPVESFEPFASPFGVVNMAGNVQEWTKDNLLKGGSYLSSEDSLRITNDEKGEAGDIAGFRCIKEEQ
ncbi:MAG: protein kinase [Candidatus Aminicenantes bacterium]|nr:protein kinase [Candidatus Aminicenantes bacterium]